MEKSEKKIRRIRVAVDFGKNFHNAGPLALRVKPAQFTGEGFYPSPSQAKRINKHLCGLAGCRCAERCTEDEQLTPFIYKESYE